MSVPSMQGLALQCQRPVIFIASLMFAAAACAAVSPAHLLKEMGINSAQLNYSGTLIYSQGVRMETMQVFHAVKDGVRKERLVHLTGEPREIIRVGDSVMCVHLKNGAVTLENQAPGGPYSRNYMARFESLNEPYRLEYIGEGRVAGRSVSLIALNPKDAHRYGFKLALDADTSLLLGSLMVNKKGQVLERFEYTQIDIGGDVDERDLEPTMHPEHHQKADDTSQRFEPVTEASLNWAVAWVPDGFEMTVHKAKQQQRRRHKGSNVMYSDGLTAFSVFFEDGVDLGHRSRQSGATAAHTLVKHDPQGVYSVTVVGEIPLSAAAKIADSVARHASP